MSTEFELPISSEQEVNQATIDNFVAHFANRELGLALANPKKSPYDLLIQATDELAQAFPDENKRIAEVLKVRYATLLLQANSIPDNIGNDLTLRFLCPGMQVACVIEEFTNGEHPKVVNYLRRIQQLGTLFTIEDNSLLPPGAEAKNHFLKSKSPSLAEELFLQNEKPDNPFKELIDAAMEGNIGVTPVGPDDPLLQVGQSQTHLLVGTLEEVHPDHFIVRDEEGIEHDLDHINVVAAGVIGVDRARYAQRAEGEVRRFDRVRVFWQGQWRVGTVDEQVMNGMVMVRLDEYLGTSALDGYGLLINAKSSDLDTRDPEKTEPKPHPLEGHPEIHMGSIFRFDVGGEYVYGEIDQIRMSEQTVDLRTTQGTWRGVHFAQLKKEATHLSSTTSRELRPELPWQNGDRFSLMIGDREHNLHTHIYELQAIDLDEEGHYFVVGKLKSNPRFGRPPRFLATRIENVILKAKASKLLEKYPELNQDIYHTIKVTFEKNGQVLTGTLIGASTLPFFIEVVCPNVHEASDDDFHQVSWENVRMLQEKDKPIRIPENR